MVELIEKDIKTNDRKSSKGNQLKWEKDGIWYKADYTGYEGLSEYMVSHLIVKSNVNEASYILYDTEKIHYKHSEYTGCKSKEFLSNDCQLITLERLFHNAYNQSLTSCIYKLESNKSRLEFIVQEIERLTGLKEFGKYMSMLMTIDALFLNEDRHLHNIAVILGPEGEYTYCPVFDNGASLLSDTTMDYPMGIDLAKLRNEAKPKTFINDFDEQLETAEMLYGQHIKFTFTKKDVDELLAHEKYYGEDVKERVKQLIYWQMQKYKYLFK
ncbi:MAG: hypothetical protein J6L69_04505 [Lachnospiraceae bacterium]|nr:hypothetical protein [Lachnospiraceae bacterium]